MPISIILGNKNGSSLLGKWWKTKIDGNFGDLGFRNSIWDPWRTPFFAIFFTKEWSSPPFLSFRHNPSFGSICFHGKTLESFSKIKLKWYYGCFLKRWYPQNHPKKWSFLVGKPMVVGYHHFRKPPYMCECLTPPFSTFQIIVFAVAATISHPFFPRSAPFLQVGSSEWSRANSTKSCLKVKVTKWYCCWKKSQTTTWDVQNPVNNGRNYQPQLGSAGFCPSTVCQSASQASQVSIETNKVFAFFGGGAKHLKKYSGSGDRMFCSFRRDCLWFLSFVWGGSFQLHKRHKQPVVIRWRIRMSPKRSRTQRLCTPPSVFASSPLPTWPHALKRGVDPRIRDGCGGCRSIEPCGQQKKKNLGNP